MTEKSQEVEFNVLGCKVKYRPEQNDEHMALAVLETVNEEVKLLKEKRPSLRDTDIAVLVALKIATEKMRIEDEYKNTILKLEESLEQALQSVEVN